MSKENDWIVAYLIQRMGGVVNVPAIDIDAWMSPHLDRSWGINTTEDADGGLIWTVYELPTGTLEERAGEASGLLDGDPEVWQLERSVWLLSNGRKGAPHWSEYAMADVV